MSETWISDSLTLPALHPRIAYRDVCRATDTRTMICALVPLGTALVGGAPYLLRQKGDLKDEAYLLGIMSSVPFDWFSRRFVEVHMKHYLLNSFPVPRINIQTGRAISLHGEDLAGDSDLCLIQDRLIFISGRLAAVDYRYTDWANEVGVPVGSVSSAAEKEALIFELDALASLLYGLSRDQVKQVFDSFHRGWDYKPRLERVLEYYAEWAGTVAR